MIIGNHLIDECSECFIIAELSANHNQNKQIALDTIKAAADTGANAIKLQTYTADTITLDVRNDYFKINQGTIWDERYLHDLYKDAFTPWEWHQDLFEEAEKQGLVCFSSPFDFTAVGLLEKLNTPAYKIASFEITDINLIKKVAETGKPIIISTGIAELEDIELALKTCRDAGNNDIALLKCTSAYPAKIEDANLIMIKDFQERFGVISGLSDHTLGITVPVASIVMGAKIIEKHFILDKSVGGPDASFSLDKKEFTEMVTAVREAEKSIGIVNYNLSEKAKKSREFSRSLFISEDVKSGDPITNNNVKSIRPGYGLPPKYLNEVIGKIFNSNLKKGTPLDFNQFN